MSYVPKHDSEEKGKRDDCEESRVELLVVGRAISINNLLEPCGEFIRVEGGWGHQVQGEIGAVDDVDL